ncbi:MAG: nitroreductase family protein [Rhodospirillaceae bacterium]|jgi:coenzyme F420-0:L-glutamate ligase / coenzyme F420-1:gamma-L-glutamate ligase|nr:nitroreductase family protein [Rhodospirillaceae bacterium]MBT5242831.1 nitroreductase family protein [Rhodospirillaceae bacterium]MBT5564032.1 nitroreductase family protein [Rhodospirillaceae bacterium]MBT6243307.1 nitroreductase family protein [Rhodospirillaceae bacterium]MBT7137141.1 nitroreductase family protein [Rhodospirillaceae bacterium]
MTNKMNKMQISDDPGGWLEFIEQRRTIRSFQSRKIEPHQLERILQAVRFAPSAHNRQPWRFAVMTDEPKKQALAKVMGDRLRSDRLADGDEVKVVNEDVARSNHRIVSAPVVILCCLTMEDMDHYPDDKRNKAEHLMAVQSVAMAAYNVLLAAHWEGLGGCWMCAPLFCPDAITKDMNLPEQWMPQALITLGWADKPPKKRGRLPLEKVVRFL